MSAANGTKTTDRTAELMRRMRDPEDRDIERTMAYFQLLNTELLILAVRGEVDLTTLAKNALASRGLGPDGEWLGFDRARQAHFGE